MSKSRKHSKRMTKSSRKSKKMYMSRRKPDMIKNTADTALYGIKTIGNVTKNVVSKSAPIVEKGVTSVYGTMATGFDLGVKGAKSAVTSIAHLREKKRSNRKTHRTY